MFCRMFFISFAIALGSLCLPVSARAANADYRGETVETQGFAHPERLYDADRATYAAAGEEGVIAVTMDGGVSAIYVEFDRLPEVWVLSDPASGVSVDCGEHGFLHEFVDVDAWFPERPDTLVLRFAAGTAVADIYFFPDGDMPEWVQIWEPPCEKADLLLVSTHSDDEQLFFSGVLPYYAGERGCEVQVAYVVQHFEANGVKNHIRPHEQLDGLWKVGVRHYPVMSEFPDLYSESKDRGTALTRAVSVYEGAGFSYDDFVEYLTECLRRFKPLVVVSHDLDGEYGHGTHVLAAAALTEAAEYAADESRYLGGADEYGTWEIEKLYLHLYEENKIVMDFDTPLERFGGKTAFEVSQEGFACHESQHWTWFYKWMYGTAERPITKASDIASYSPCLYGLYFTRVGLDAEGGDFFENVETYEERAKAAAEAEREEAERLEMEAEREREARARLEEQEAAVDVSEADDGAAEGAKIHPVGWGILALAVWTVLCGGIIHICGRRRGKRRAGSGNVKKDRSGY